MIKISENNVFDGKIESTWYKHDMMDVYLDSCRYYVGKKLENRTVE